MTERYGERVKMEMDPKVADLVCEVADEQKRANDLYQRNLDEAAEQQKEAARRADELDKTRAEAMSLERRNTAALEAIVELLRVLAMRAS